ncbi:MAG: SIMPL domain-containing protein [Candidatus Gastranaerophilales bacterium]|nr:SIMPL domain-containing protein [Candidatus Gastranaerophilales bacterium]
MKNIRIKLFTLLLCVLAIPAQYAAAAVSASQKETGYISLSNSAVKEVEPNLASVSFAVENTADDAQKAVSENNIISNKIAEALKQISGNSSDVISTNSFSVRPNYAYSKDGKRTIKNYTAINSIKVQTKDVKKIADYIDTAIANGANKADGLTYTLDNHKNLCKDMYSDLIKQLYSEADTIAQSAGTSLNGIKRLSASCNTNNVVSNRSYYTAKSLGAIEDAAEQSSVSTPVEAGKIKINVHISADFYVK